MTELERFKLAVYELFLTVPYQSAFRDVPGPEDEPFPLDPEMLMAIQADRFALMRAVREPPTVKE